MTKVYGSLKMVFVVCVFFFPALYVCFRGQIFSAFNWAWAFPAAFLICVGFIVFFSFNAAWAFGEEGIEIYSRSGKVLKKYNWNDVSKITYFAPLSKYFISFPLLQFNDDRQIALWYFSIKDYPTILKNLVRLTRKKNPQVFIDSVVLRKAE